MTHPIGQDTPAARQIAETTSTQNARFAIDGAIAFGRANVNKPPSDDHWLMEYWQIGRQLAEAKQDAGWQPIETAPKDGTHIMLTNGITVAQGWWEHQEPYVHEKRDIEGRYIDQDEHDGFDDWLDCTGGMKPDPTHYMPLPPAPAMQAKEPS